MKIAIVGAGASGLTAAITAARCGINASDITIYEAHEKCARKILATGNGRCNLGNENLSADMFYTSSLSGDEFIKSLISEVSVDDIRSFFDSLGILVTSKEGYLYPRSMQALTVRDALLAECSDLGIRIMCESLCTGIFHENGRYRLSIGNRDEYADRVILSFGLSSGGFKVDGFDACSFFNALGIPFNEPLPALCALNTFDDLRSLKGVRAKGRVSLYVSGDFASDDAGEIQFTEKTVSGIPVFQISRFASKALNAGKKVYVLLDLLDEYDAGDLRKMIEQRAKDHPRRECYHAFSGLINNKLMSYVMKRSGISDKSPAGSLDKDRLHELAVNLKALRFDIRSAAGMDNAQTMSGGVDISCITGECELKDIKDLYVSGELLDIDAKCGGYNLYLAWATGLICGRSVSK